MTQTLLLVDDSVTIQRVIELTFAGEAIAVVAVGNGDEAIERIEASPPDIVLADVGMPGRNGYEVARHIKQSSRLAHIPVILLTGTLEPVDQARAREAGCDDVLVKPFEPQQVISRVKELLGGHGQKEALDQYFARLDRELTSLASAPPARGDAPEDGRRPSPHTNPGASPVATLSRGLPPMAEAFAAMLAAEREDAPAGATMWPASAPGEDLIEAVVQRVMTRLSDTVVRDRVDEIVSRVAERLVREEIERIKSAIK